MIDWLLYAPAYLKVGISFFGILMLNRVGYSLGIAILLFSLFLSLWSGAGTQGLYFQAVTFAQAENYLLPIVITLLLFFSEALTATGRIERTMRALQNVLKSNKTLFIGLPALIGMLPMPGGAIFSAPLVAAADAGNECSPMEKVVINYWFRHIWEYWWPMYPGVILAIRYSGLPFTTFLLIQIPLTFAALMGGYFFILRKIKLPPRVNSVTAGFDVGNIFAALGPIILLVATAIIGSAILPATGISKTAASLLSMLIGLLLAVTFTFIGHREALSTSFQIFRRRNTWLMILLVISLQVFSAVLSCPIDHAGATIVSTMRNEFINAGIPLLVVIMMIPFVSGIITGVAFGFVGASFPIVFALIGQHPTLGVTAATTTFAYAFGYIGMMLSPMHVCFVVSCEYFNTSLAGAYRYIAGPSFMVLLSALILSGMYYWLL
jgi:integral membrane protein (TIGR00529 family)